MYEARPLAGTTPIALAVCDTDRAEALRDAGMTREAERLLASVAPVFGRHRMPQSRAEVEFQLARSQLTHDPVTAARTAATASRRFRALGAETWAIRADGIRLRARLSRRSPRSADQAEVERVASALADSGFANESTALRLSLDIWRSGRGMPHPAPVTRVPPTASIDVRLLGYEARAARAAAAGRDAVARRQSASGLDQLTAWQQAFGSLDLQTSVRMHAGGLMVAGLTAAARSGRADVLFEWSERGRHLSHQVVPVRPPEDPQLAADLAELRQRMSGDQTGRWRLDPHFAELEERARERQWSATRGGGIRRRATLREVQARLDDGTALLSFVYTGTELAVIVVTGARARVVPLPGWAAAAKLLPGLRADLDMAASIRTGPMADVVRRSLDDRLASLSSALLDKAVRVPGAERFVLTVPGILEGTPWAMLPALRGRTFTVAVSATRWSAFDRDVSVGGRVGIAVGPRVARGEEEADAVAAAWAGHSPEQLRGTDATVDAVTALAGRVDLLHVAAHGRHAVDNPLFSGFEMADGALFGYDLDRVPEVPEVVVLSSCEAGRSSVRWGEEAVGMTRVWMHAGTRAVVAAPVIVADDAACDLLGAMHAGLAAGLGVSEALARASTETGILAPFQVYGSGF
ncbi:CHAT domain-containing protein [Microbacterium sp. CH-015]